MPMLELTHLQPSDIVWRERVHMIQEAKGITARTDGESSSFRAVRIGLKKIRVSSDIAATKRPKDEVMHNANKVE